MSQTALPAPGARPIEIAVTRGRMVESRHFVVGAVMDADGSPLASWGDVEAPVYPRSANKPLQALALVETGAADAFGLSARELAIACASHSGQTIHVETVRGWLARAGLPEAALACGSHWPYDEAATEAMMLRGERPGPAHNNCSGKHAGMLCTALHMGEPLETYVEAAHPVQQRIIATMGEMVGLDLAAAPLGVDGCSIPTLAVPLDRLAFAIARFGAPGGLPPARADACRRLAAAVAAEPLMLAGQGRFDSLLIAATAGRVLSKSGAEGVNMTALPRRGLGIALKAVDGAPRAVETALMAVLRWLGEFVEAELSDLAELAEPLLRNRRGLVVGRIQPLVAAGF